MINLLEKQFTPLSAYQNTSVKFFFYFAPGFNLFVAIKVLVKWTFTLKMISSE